MKIKSILSLAAILIVLSSLCFSQSKQTGAIGGTVMDEENTPLPGVTVTLTGTTLMGERIAVTDEKGLYRFPALPPGMYTIKAELIGFAIQFRENVRLHTTVRLSVDFTLKVATMEEEVTLVAESPTVDVKSSETASVTLADELLRNMPTSQFVIQIVNLAPGVDQNVAYGASSDTGISYQVDGVDVSDPEAGSAWVFLDYNIIEEAKVMGIGLPAEYGAFTGVIFNTITKSGGNEFSGHFEFIFQDTKKGFWTAENNQQYLEDFPDLESPLQGLMDTSYHLGGPIKKDKIWFFFGAQWYRSKNRPYGFQTPNFVDYKQPRGFLKITSQPSSKMNLKAFVEVDAYNGTNIGADAILYPHPTPETCVEQTSPEIVGNFDLTTIISPNTFFDIKGAFFLGYYYLMPQIENWEEVPAVWSTEDWQWYDNSNWWFKADRKRYQANASLSHYAEDFIKGNHDFKFGAELEYGWVRNRFGHTGYVQGIGSAAYIYNYYNYLYAYQYEGYDTQSSYTRTEFFAQDSWSIFDNFTVNAGVRFSLMRGFVKDVSGAAYKTERVAPRIGFAWDIFSDHSTVLKAHYGQFTEAMLTALFDRLNPASHYSDYVAYYESFPGSGQWIEDWRITPQNLYSLDPNINHPYLEQWTVGIERELFKDASLGISYINRAWKDIVGLYDTNGQYRTDLVFDPVTGDPIPVYNMLNPGEYQFVIANIKKGDPWILVNPYRSYWGIEVLFNKRFSNRWQLLASYLYSVCKGTIDNSFAGDIGWAGSINDPNFWTNAEGNSTADPTHMFKLQGTVVLPLDIYFNAYFRYISGNTYTRQIKNYLEQGWTTIFTEARGSRRYPDKMTLDLRLEKSFRIGHEYRLGFMLDIFNVFNEDTITEWGTIVDKNWFPDDPTKPGPDGHNVLTLVPPRAIRVGIRLFF